MPPKKTDGAAPKAKAAPAHASYQLKDRNGSSRQSLKKYVKANNTLVVTDNMFDSLFNKALKAGVEKGVFAQPKGPSGGTKLAKKAAPAKKPAAKKAAPKKDAAKKPAVKKAAAPKKAAVPKGEKKAAAPKKAAAAPKKAVAKKPSAVAKPEKPETVLTKTKSGRVAKTQKPAVKKAAAPKKAAPKKAAAKA